MNVGCGLNPAPSITSQHVLVLSSLDVDALCACKILQAMFKADDVQHTLIPVAGKADLQSAFADQADQVNLVEQGRVFPQV